MALVAGKEKAQFRNYCDSDRQSTVENHYRNMRTHQTVEYVDRMVAKFGKFDKAEMTIAEAFDLLKDFVDASDPDTAMPNLEHMLQSAEAVRAAGHPDWLQLTALMHDLGKVVGFFGTEEDGLVGNHPGGAQWGIAGDTWVVGCRIPDCTVFPEFNSLNPDMHDPKFSTRHGVYEEGCGFDNLKMAWGHDEYLYRVLKFNGCALPEEGMAMIRYHSCYPWFAGAYDCFMTDKDRKMKEWVLMFNQFDLYTKADERPNVQELWPYYQGLIDKFCPGKLKW